jgi:predicted Rdx family selenoprotein
MPDVQSVRQLLRDFIAPELRDLKDDVRRLETQFSTDVKRLDSEISTDMKRLESTLSSDVKLLESKVDNGFAELRSLIENRDLRAELETTRDIADLRERITRLEVERGSQQ